MPGPPTGRPPGTTSRTRDVQRLNPSHTDPIVTRAWYLWVRYGALYTQYVEKCSIAPQVGKRSCPHSNHDPYGVVHGPIEVHNAKQRTCPTARIDAPFVSTAIATSTQCPVASHWRSLTPPQHLAHSSTPFLAHLSLIRPRPGGVRRVVAFASEHVRVITLLINGTSELCALHQLHPSHRNCSSRHESEGIAAAGVCSFTIGFLSLVTR